MVFVIDSTDIERLEIAADELRSMLNEDELKEAALLVFANKQDQVSLVLGATCALPLMLTIGSPGHKVLVKSRRLSNSVSSGIGTGASWPVLALMARASRRAWTGCRKYPAQRLNTSGTNGYSIGKLFLQSHD